MLDFNIYTSVKENSIALIYSGIVKVSRLLCNFPLDDSFNIFFPIKNIKTSLNLFQFSSVQLLNRV